MEDQKEVAFKLHAIQLIGVHVKELSIVAHEAPDLTVGIDAEEEGVCSIMVGHGGYNEEERLITTALKLEIGESEEGVKSPFSLKIEIIGAFKVNEERFDKEHIIDFARRNAPYIMMPYLREQAYALTAKCGFRPIILPLTEVPVSKPKG